MKTWIKKIGIFLWAFFFWCPLLATEPFEDEVLLAVVHQMAVSSDASHLTLQMLEKFELEDLNPSYLEYYQKILAKEDAVPSRENLQEIIKKANVFAQKEERLKAQPKETLGETLNRGVVITIVGMAVVMFSLMVLMFVCYANAALASAPFIKKIDGKIDLVFDWMFGVEKPAPKKQVEKKEPEKKESLPQVQGLNENDPAMVAAVAAAVAVAKSSLTASKDTELVAVISAAAMVALGAPVRIVSYEEVGREEYGRFGSWVASTRMNQIQKNVKKS